MDGLPSVFRDALYLSGMADAGLLQVCHHTQQMTLHFFRVRIDEFITPAPSDLLDLIDKSITRTQVSGTSLHPLSLVVGVLGEVGRSDEDPLCLQMCPSAFQFHCTWINIQEPQQLVEFAPVLSEVVDQCVLGRRNCPTICGNPVRRLWMPCQRLFSVFPAPLLP